MSVPERANEVRPRPRIHWPAVLTIAGVVLVVPVVALTLTRSRGASWVAFFAFGIAALTDGLDGFAARRMQLVSSAGQLWDPIADKILVTASMVALVIVGRFPAWAAWVIIGREAAVTVLRWVADRRGHGFPASITGKMKTGAQLLAVLLYILPSHTAPGWLEGTFLVLAVGLSVISGIQYFMRAPTLLTDAR
ncbi:MAG TPA: CDP-diacylglycerol--glycerol-3-phosphate 3-phosphatidyltransferase [Actinomycetota bacterium]|nr:CDP-diacylglycerol--glycerol-3-phosphate 3-phosphatidyltransferase [Actinomycetota bacterium]